MVFGVSDADAATKSPTTAIEPTFTSVSWAQTDVQPRCRSELTSGERSQMERFAFEHATSAESYDIVISNGSFLETPCKNGLISVLQHGRHWHISGALIAGRIRDLSASDCKFRRDVSCLFEK
ncbi:MAG: hypothetical protein O2856_10250, partial [Planctomycetota bacterium]|nr:hypothetical protein [Planctomycetota bacterium]